MSTPTTANAAPNPGPATEFRPVERVGLLAALATGSLVGLAFAAVDALAATWLTRAAVGDLQYRPQSLVSFLLSGLVHAAIGAAAALVGLVFVRRAAGRLERDPRELLARVATLGVIAALAAHAASLLPNRAIELRLILGIAAALAAGILASFETRSLATRLSGVAAPWLAAMSLGLVPWLADTPLSTASWDARQWTGFAAFGLLAAAAVLQRSIANSPRLHGAPAILGLYIFALSGSAIDQGVIEIPREGRRLVQGPNVILITLDTVRADHLSVYGYERDTTPFLAEFARDAVRFTRSSSAADFTLPSHASLFTGRYPIDHGARPDPNRVISRPLGRDSTTLAEMLADGGWWTAAVIANCVLLAPQFGTAQGFEHYDARYRRMLFPRTPPWALRARLHDALEDRLPRREFDVPFRDAASINADVIALLERRPAERPFFLFVNYMDAHAPLRPPAPYDTLFSKEARSMDMPRFLQQKGLLYSGKGQLPREDRESYLALYDGSIAYLDAHLRELFARLKELGLYDDTLIIVTSDHGEAFGGHSTLEHGMSVYQEQTFVPLLIKPPHSRGGEVVDRLANGVDVLPTVLAVLGLAIPEGLRGAALLGTPPAEDRVVFSEHYPTKWHVSLDAKRAVHQTAARVGRYVFVRRDDGGLECYDIVDDPRQERPLASLPPIAAELTPLLEHWTAPPRSSPSAEDRRTIDALRSLGYAK